MAFRGHNMRFLRSLVDNGRLRIATRNLNSRQWIPSATGVIMAVLFVWGMVRACSNGVVVSPELHDSTISRKPLAIQPSLSSLLSSDSSSAELIEQSKPLVEALMNKSFSLGPKINDWDTQRQAWLQKHPQLVAASPNSSPGRMLLVTSSHPKPCENAIGDHILLKSAKNKMDYCRLHNIEMFYNVAKLDSALPGFWIKMPLLRAAMISHPESEWILWMDSDALFTDMTFQIPIQRYEGYNLALNGWDHLVYGNRSWTGLNMGIFLIRNCQWSLDLLDILAQMGVDGPVSDEIGKILSRTLSDRPLELASDDQGALLWLMVAEREKWGSKIFLEHSYDISGYWLPLVFNYEENMRKHHPGLGDDRWPFITHFAGCEFCEGFVNKNYAPEDCRKQIERAFNFGDNQVLEIYGFRHPSLNSGEVQRTASHGIPR